MKDTENRILTVNTAVADAVGSTPEAMANTDSARWYPHDAESYYQDDIDVIQSATPKKGIIEVKRNPAGNARLIQTDKYPICSRTGSVEGLLVIATDVTSDWRRQERPDSANRLATIASLSGQVIHDVNNWLLTALGNIEVAGLKSRDSTIEATLQDASLAVRHAAKKAEQLLQVIRGRPRAEHNDEFDLNTAVRQGLELLGSSIPTGIEVSSNLSNSGPSVRGDADELLDVLLNLIINACDEMQGAGSLIISTRHPKGSGYAVLSVTDSGGGIPEEIVPHIFDPMFTTKEKGVGLGLASVARIVQDLGGRVEVETTVGKGTSIHVFLPIGK